MLPSGDANSFACVPGPKTPNPDISAMDIAQHVFCLRFPNAVVSMHLTLGIHEVDILKEDSVGLGYCISSLIGFKRIICRKMFQRVLRAILEEGRAGLGARREFFFSRVECPRAVQGCRCSTCTARACRRWTSLPRPRGTRQRETRDMAGGSGCCAGVAIMGMIRHEKDAHKKAEHE